MGSLKDSLCCDRNLRIAAAVNPFVIEPMLNWLETLRGFPVCGEYAFSIMTVVSLATSTTPENPLSACARAIALSRAGVWAAIRATGKSSIITTRRFLTRLHVSKCAGSQVTGSAGPVSELKRLLKRL
jgi:hypothetical protein